MIPYLDLHRINAPYEEDIKAALNGVVDSGWYLFGKQVEAFEKEFAEYTNQKHCVTCANGLDALRLTLRAWMEMGMMNEGDEVIVPANTYIASILAVSDNGLCPVPVETDEKTLLIDPKAIESTITERTKAIMPVHLYGMECNMDAINAIAEKYNLLVVEDCAQYHCKRDSNSNSNSDSDNSSNNVQCYSFYPGKNLGALGDAGAVCTDDEQLAMTIRRLAFYGSEKKYVHIYKGLNSRMDELQAAVLRIKLKDLDRCNERRKEIARRYCEEITTVTLPPMSETTVWHIFPVLSQHRDELQQYLADKGIGTQIHYPIPPHKQKAYMEWNDKSFPITEKIAREELSLPCNQSMTDSEVEYVIQTINAFEA